MVSEVEVDVFLEFSCFFKDSTDVGNLISGSSAFCRRKGSHGFFPTDTEFTEGTALQTRQLNAVRGPDTGLYNKATRLRGDMFNPPAPRHYHQGWPFSRG